MQKLHNLKISFFEHNSLNYIIKLNYLLNYYWTHNSSISEAECTILFRNS